MKMMQCPVCGDWIILTLKLKKCSCGLVSGRYLSDVRTVLVSPNAILQAIPNSKIVDVESFFIRTEDTNQPDEMFAGEIRSFWDKWTSDLTRKILEFKDGMD